MPSPARSDAFVFFGWTGDLAFKQIFPALVALTRQGRLDLPVLAINRDPSTVDDVLDRARKSLEANAKDGKVSREDTEALAALGRRVVPVQIDFDDVATFARIRDALHGAKHPLFYCALPPSLFGPVAQKLAGAGLAEGARIVLEKPFGHDLASAQQLAATLRDAQFPEESLFRIDHFLGKEPVENIVYFRAANPLIEDALRADRVESVQLTMAEAFGVEGREAFYDANGAIRDVVQNHLLEVVACIAMELPEVPGHAALRDARGELLAQVAPINPARTVRGQFEGYAEEHGVAAGSTTETYVALELAIDSERWKGVPWFIRTGKALAVTATEAVVRWKPPAAAVLDDATRARAGYLRLGFGADAAIALGVSVKQPGEGMVGEPAELLASKPPGDAMAPYERLLGDALDGDHTLFSRQAEVEASWRVVEPILGDVVPVRPYAKGSWGPTEAAAIAPPGGWRDPG